MSPPPLSVVLVEDDADDAAFVERALAAGGVAARCTRVQTREALEDALRAGADLVVTDYRLPHFDGRAALACVQAVDPTLPVIVVSGRLPDDEAVALMRAGAADFVLKDKLGFLAPAVTRALAARADAAARREAERAQAALIGNLPGMVFRAVMHAGAWQLTFVSDGALALTGYTAAQLAHPAQVDYVALIHPDDAPGVLADAAEAIRNGRTTQLEYRLRHRDGEWRWARGWMTAVYGPDGAMQAMEGFVLDVTDRTRAELALRESHQRFELVGRATTDIIWDWDLVTGTVRRSEPVDGGPDFGMDAASAVQEDAWSGLLHPDDEQRVVRSVREAIERGRTRWSQQFRLRRGDGSYAHVHDRGHVVRDAVGRAVRMIGATQDISERVRAEQALSRHARAQSMLADFGREALGLRDTGALLARAVEVLADALRADAAAVIELDADDGTVALRAGTTGGALPLADAAASRPAPASSRPWLGAAAGSALEVPLRKGELPHGLLGVYAAREDAFDPESLDVLRSIGTTLEAALERKAAEDAMLRLAQYDTLTGLPNRMLLMDRLGMLLARAGRHERPVAVLFMDVDRFKNINDTWGHGAGDHLLREVAGRLVDCLRPGDTVSRFGGDEFVIVLDDLARVTDVEPVVRRVIDALAAPFEVAGGKMRVTASVGIACAPGDGVDAETLVKNADTAMYRAKETGRDTFQFFTGELNRRVIERLEVERELGDALERGEFELHYQPRIDLASGRTIGAEALVRWRHPVRGLLAPGHFIGVAEESGLVLPLGRWVMHAACAQLRRWHAGGHPGLRMAVNVSPAELRRADVPAQVHAAMSESGIAPALLEIELTESLLMDGADAFIDALQALRATGVSIAIDDFGTGYSSLAYLKRFPIDTLKIDRAFVTDVATDADDAAIVRAVIALARQLRLGVVAEGVETQAQADFLRAHGCGAAQGYLFGRPMPAAAFDAWLARAQALDMAG